MIKINERPRSVLDINTKVPSGFSMTFENGNTISVQFGSGNYCSNRNESKRIVTRKVDDKVNVSLQAIVPDKDLNFNGNGIRGNYKQTCFALTKEAAMALYLCLRKTLKMY